MNQFNPDLVERFAQRVYTAVDPVSGMHVPMPLERIQLTPWAYTLTFNAIAQAQQQTQPLNIQANSDFMLLDVSLRPNLAAVAEDSSTAVMPFIRLLLTDSGTNEQLMAAPVDVTCYCNIPGVGDGASRSLPYPRLLTGRSSLTVQASNYSPAAGETYSFDLVFSGVNMRLYG